MSSTTPVLPFRTPRLRPVGGDPPSWIEATRRSLVALSDQPVRAAFLRRAIGEVLVYAQQDDEVLLEVLSSPAPLHPLFRPEDEVTNAVKERPRWAAALKKGREGFDTLLEAEGGTLSVDDVATRLATSRQTVYQRLRKGRLLAVPGRRGVVFPAWQFVEGEVISGLDVVLGEMEGVAPGMVVQFFLSAQDRLGGQRPLDALRAGKVDLVQAAATEFTAEK